ncbi:MAG: peptide chain release factor-like protein [Pirellula sp.]
MKTTHPVDWSDEELLAHCKWTFSRASGPGGQHRNKVETCANVEHLPTGISARASERRTQADNRRVALHRLRCKLAVELPSSNGNQVDSPETPTEIAITASPLWQEYCREGRINVSENNRDMPNLIAEVINALSRLNWDDMLTANSLSTTRSQIIKLLKKCPPAFARLNAERTTRGLKPLE